MEKGFTRGNSVKNSLGLGQQFEFEYKAHEVYSESDINNMFKEGWEYVDSLTPAIAAGGHGTASHFEEGRMIVIFRRKETNK